MRKSLLLGVVLSAGTLMAYAGAKARTMVIMFEDAVSVAGSQLKAGTYEVRVNAEQTVATFYRGSSQVARAAVHDQPSSTKFGHNEFIVESQTLKEVHVAGTMDNLVIDGPAK